MSHNKHLVPVCIIYLDGDRLSTVCEGAFRSVVAFDRLNGVGQCTVTFDRHDLPDKDARVFSYNTRLSLHLGYKDDTQEVFNGEITGLKISLRDTGPCLFKVTASSCLQRLGHGRHYRVFENKTPGQAVQETLSRYGLQVVCDSFGTRKAYWEGWEQTDLELVLDILFCLFINYIICKRQNNSPPPREGRILLWGQGFCERADDPIQGRGNL